MPVYQPTAPPILSGDIVRERTSGALGYVDTVASDRVNIVFVAGDDTEIVQAYSADRDLDRIELVCRG